MNNIILLFFTISSIFSCKKEDTKTTAPTGTEKYATINTTIQYATAADGSALQINIQTPADIDTGKSRPLIMLTSGTGANERNPLSISPYTTNYLSQGFVVANFNFYGSDNTRTNDDGKHLTAQYAAVVDYLKTNAATYHINTGAIIACGTSGSGANAVDVALIKNLFGCFISCSGRNISFLNREPATLSKTLYFGGIQTQSDAGFGGYRFNAADVGMNSTFDANYNEIDTKAKLSYPGDNQYCTAWGDCGLKETYNHLIAKYGSKISSPAGYVSIIPNSSDHCPGGTAWVNSVTIIPKRMLNDGGIIW